MDGRICIIIPTYNATQLLPFTLESVLAQTYGCWNLVVIDDGSRDATAELVETYVRRDDRIRLVRQQNAGVAGARNRGLRELSAETEYVLLLDHDDLLEPDAVATLMQKLRRCPEAPAVHGAARFIDANGRALRPGEAEAVALQRRGIIGGRLEPIPVEGSTSFAVLTYINCICTPGQVLFRRKALAEIDPFDPAIAPYDDWDVYLRLSQQGDIAFVPTVVLNYRQHLGQESRDGRIMRRAELRMRRKHLVHLPLSPEQRRVLQAGYHYAERDSGAIWMRLARKTLAERRYWMAALLMRRVVSHYVRSLPGVPV